MKKQHFSILFHLLKSFTTHSPHLYSTRRIILQFSSKYHTHHSGKHSPYDGWHLVAAAGMDSQRRSLKYSRMSTHVRRSIQARVVNHSRGGARCPVTGFTPPEEAEASPEEVEEPERSSSYAVITYSGRGIYYSGNETTRRTLTKIRIRAKEGTVIENDQRTGGFISDFQRLHLLVHAWSIDACAGTTSWLLLLLLLLVRVLRSECDVNFFMGFGRFR